MKHIVTAKWLGNSLFEAETPGGKITMGLGEEGGLGPKALMLDALIGCTGIDIASIVKKMRLEVDNININAEAELTEEHPKLYKNVTLQYHFFGDQLDEEKLERAVSLSTEKYCGVMDMFRKFVDVEVKIKYN